MEDSTQIFTTQNEPLALALLTAGCELATMEEGGPAVNVYTVATLQAKGFGGRNLKQEQAVKLAEEKKIPGAVSYLFRRNDLLSRCYKSWCDVEKRMREMQAGEVLAMSPEDIVAAICVATKNRRDFKSLAWVRSPIIATGDFRSESGEEGKSRTTGRGKMYSLNASAETRRKLGV